MKRIKPAVWQTLLISLAMTVCVSGAVWYFSGRIITLFALSAEAAVYCTAHLRTVAFINIILAAYIPLFGVFQGANHSGVPTVVATGALGMRVLVTYLFRHSAFFGHTIIWWNGLFGFGVGFLITWTYYLSKKWQDGSRIA